MIEFEGKDNYKDRYDIQGYEDGAVFLELFCETGDNRLLHFYTPKKARKLAYRLLAAADFAEGATAVGELA